MKITVIGSASDNGYSDTAVKLAEELGREIASRGHVLMYGPERQMPSLPYMVAKSAKAHGGLTVAIAIGSARSGFFDPEAATFNIYTESNGGAGREVVLVNSADAVISVGGGSGTLTEIGIAYMNYIPVVAMKGSGGWSDKLIDQFLDERKKYRIPGAISGKDAVDHAERMFAELKDKPSQSVAPIFNHAGSR